MSVWLLLLYLFGILTYLLAYVNIIPIEMATPVCLISALIFGVGLSIQGIRKPVI